MLVTRSIHLMAVQDTKLNLKIQDDMFLEVVKLNILMHYTSKLGDRIWLIKFLLRGLAEF